MPEADSVSLVNVELQQSILASPSRSCPEYALALRISDCPGMPDARIIEWIRDKYRAVVSDLDERGRRRWAAAEARSLGWGGVTAVATATGMSDRTIRNGIRELQDPAPLNSARQRQPGGSNSPRTRLWLTELQSLANDLAMIVEVCHYPPGTSKWNKIEHRLFCHITRNWKGIPLETLEIVISLIGSTTTEEGLEVHAWLDSQTYDKGRKVSDTELSEVYIKRNSFHGDWNYEIHPRTKSATR